MNDIQGVLFDKDGTLFDFHATWSVWTRHILFELAGGDENLAQRLGYAVGYDLGKGIFAPESPIISATPDDIAAALLPLLPGGSPLTIVARMNTSAAETPLVPAVPLAPLMETLRAQGLKLGVATNDAESAAHAHLSEAGVAQFFDFVAGYDSGWGGKPGPGMMRAFAEKTGLEPAEVLMVGDSRHDLIAGRAAGMRCVAVLTGPATEAELRPLAEVVLPDIGALPRWISAQNLAESAA